MCLSAGGQDVSSAFAWDKQVAQWTQQPGAGVQLSGLRIGEETEGEGGPQLGLLVGHPRVTG